MGKIFFSYSWAQDELVSKIADNLGRDFVVQDKYIFEEGNKLDDEMKKNIDLSDMFVLFLSNASIMSPNVRLELDYVLPLVAADKILFCPIYIDNQLNIEDNWDRYDWIKKYLLTYTSNVPRIDRILRQKIRNLYGKKYGLKKKFFQGRDGDKQNITADYFYSVDGQRRALIVSGIPKIGRKSLIVNTLLTNLDTSLDPYYEPITISLTDTDSIDTVIEQLREYSSVQDISKRLSEGDYVNLLTDILNELQKDHQRILIDDKKSIVLSDGKIVDWFLDLIKCKRLVSYTHFFVASEISVSPYCKRKYPQIQTYRLSPLNKDDMRIIFTSYAKSLEVSCSTEETDFFLNQFNGYPQMIINVVDDIAKSGLVCAKKWLHNNLKLYDSTNRELLEDIKKDNDLYPVVLVLSKFEYLSYDILCELLPSINIQDQLEKLYYKTLYEFFGEKYYRLSRNLSDYINRNKVELSSDLENKIRKIGQQSIEDLNTEYLDLSEKLHCVKVAIRDNPQTVPTDLLLPSFSLKVIIELYQKKEYENVVCLALRLLNDPHKNIYDSIKRSVIYWLCLAASREYNKYGNVYNDNVDYFYNKNNNATYFFLKGFFERCKKNYKNAKKWYEKSLECHKDKELKNYLAKVHHELALVYMKLEDPKALDFAKENFEQSQDNAYHIETYFRCLVRSENPDVNILKSLLAKMEESHDRLKDVILDTFKAEYSYYIDHDVNAIKTLEQVIITYPKTIQYPIDALNHIKKIEKNKGNDLSEIEKIVTSNPCSTDDITRFDID